MIMEEKKIIVPLSEWDKMLQENIRLKSQLEEERKKLQDSAKHSIVHWQSITVPNVSEEEFSVSMEWYDRLVIHTNEDVIYELCNDCEKFREEYYEKEKELAEVRGMSVWAFIKMKWNW